MTDLLAGDGFRLRRAEPRDVEFLVALANHEEIEPFLAAVSAKTAEELAAEVVRSRKAPSEAGRFVLEVPNSGGWQSAGALAFEVVNHRSRIASLYSVALEPSFRGRALAEEALRLLTRHLFFALDYHRVELEVYGFNVRATRLFERAGFVREGAKRAAYRRHGEWTDGVIFGLVREDLAG